MATWVKPTVYSLCVLLCICSVQMAEAWPTKIHTPTLTFYVHEIRAGPNATILVAAGPGMAKWGTFLVNDNKVRSGESTTSKLIGGYTAFGAITSQQGIAGGIMSVSKVTFNQASRYKASTLTFIGTVATPLPPYEASVVGGTGKFRGVRGYALATPGVATPPLFPTKWEVYLSWK